MTLDPIAFASALISAVALAVSIITHKRQALLSQRQFLPQLYQEVKSLREINPENPIGPDVIKIINTLEFIAICVEGGIVDRDIVRRLFRKNFVRLYGQIDAAGQIPGLGRRGRELTQDMPAASKLYDEFRQEIQNVH